MPTLNIITVPTYNLNTIMVVDASIYDTDPPTVVSPTLEIKPPGFLKATLPFTVNGYNVFTSINLGISTELHPLPDGIYHLKYSVAPAYENFVEKSILKVDRLQEKFDEAFMKLEMMECDSAIKAQDMVTLDSVYYLIQGAIASANNCALINADQLYQQASAMLNNFMKKGCGCSGNNYFNNFRL